MTTIAWDGKTLAADTQSVTQTIDAGETQKIFKRKGKLYGIAGDYAQGLAVIDWLEGGKKPEFSDPSFDVMVISGGEARVYSDQFYPYPVNPPFGIGSGAGYAIAAMLSGARARQAVKIASQLDPYTGGRIRTFQT